MIFEFFNLQFFLGLVFGGLIIFGIYPLIFKKKDQDLSTFESNLQNIDKSTQGKIPLEAPRHQELSYSVDEIDYLLNIEQFTEGKVDIPIQATNVPRGYELKLFPEEVSLHYVVSLDDFDLVDKQMFEAQVKYDAEKSARRNRVYPQKFCNFET